MTNSSPDVIIERLTQFSLKDTESIRRLAAQIGPHFKPLTNKDFKDMLFSPSTFLFVARTSTDQNIVGMITLIVYRIPYLKKSLLEDFVVDETYRGQGIGSRLLEKALSFAKKQGATHVDFTSRPGRVKSNKLYEKLGFKKRDTNVYRLMFDYAKK